MEGGPGGPSLDYRPQVGMKAARRRGATASGGEARITRQPNRCDRQDREFDRLSAGASQATRSPAMATIKLVPDQSPTPQPPRSPGPCHHDWHRRDHFGRLRSRPTGSSPVRNRPNPYSRAREGRTSRPRTLRPSNRRSRTDRPGTSRPRTRQQGPLRGECPKGSIRPMGSLVEFSRVELFRGELPRGASRRGRRLPRPPPRGPGPFPPVCPPHRGG